jgi:membrane protease YdiL (CAAX protease family)
LGSFFGTFFIVILETYVFQPNLPQLPTTPRISLWANLLTVFYGGIVEEVLLRLFLMTLLVWVFSRFQKSQNKISDFIYWTAIVLSTLFFGLGHLPPIASFFGGLTPLLVIRALIANGLLGILFGYLYWKKGFEYAILSHMSADLFLHVILPPLFLV